MRFSLTSTHPLCSGTSENQMPVVQSVYMQALSLPWIRGV